MNYFELYPGDYLRDTGELSLAQHGAYLLLMASYYSTEDGLPADKVSLCRITRAMTKDEQAATMAVASRFFRMADDGRLHSTRIDDDIEKARARKERARTNGGKGGRPAKQNPDGVQRRNQKETQEKPTGFTVGSENGNLDGTQKKAHQTPYTSKEQEQKQTEASPNVTGAPAGADPSIAPTSAGMACRLMRQAGCAHSSPENPDLHAALRLGATPEQLGQLGAQAVAAGKRQPFGWAVATALRRLQDGEPVIPPEKPYADRQPSGRGSAVERVRAANERAADESRRPIEGTVRVLAD